MNITFKPVGVFHTQASDAEVKGGRRGGRYQRWLHAWLVSWLGQWEGL